MEKEAVISELQRVARLDQSQYLSVSMFKKHGKIHPTTVADTFGSWNEAIGAAGLVPIPPGGLPKSERKRQARLQAVIGDDDLLRDLIRLEQELGRRPSGSQLKAKGKFGPAMYKKRWKSVAAACEVAHERFGKP